MRSRCCRCAAALTVGAVGARLGQQRHQLQRFARISAAQVRMLVLFTESKAKNKLIVSAAARCTSTQRMWCVVGRRGVLPCRLFPARSSSTQGRPQRAVGIVGRRQVGRRARGAEHLGSARDRLSFVVCRFSTIDIERSSATRRRWCRAWRQRRRAIVPCSG